MVRRQSMGQRKGFAMRMIGVAVRNEQAEIISRAGSLAIADEDCIALIQARC